MKNKTFYVCAACGHKSIRWYGKCPSCGAVCSDRNAVFCPTCGSKLSQTVKCSDCGKELPAYTKFCPYCGKPVQNTGAAANNGGAGQ